MQIPLTNINHSANLDKTERLTPAPQTSASPELELPDPVSDHLFLNNIRPEQAREFLLNQINRKLEVSSSNQTKNVSEYTENNVETGEDTTHQIIASINQTLSNLNDSSGLNSEKIATVANEVNSGFNETRQIFQNLNVLRDEFLTDFNDIQQDVNRFINNLSSNVDARVVDHTE